jgi:hypothetical protein
MLERPELTMDQREAGQQFLKAMDQIHKGKDPNGLFADIEP